MSPLIESRVNIYIICARIKVFEFEPESCMLTFQIFSKLKQAQLNSHFDEYLTQEKTQ